MKLLALALLLPAAASADILTSLMPFLAKPTPDYSKEHRDALEPASLAPISPGDSDLGFQQILGSGSGMAPVNFSFDVAANYTDNAPGIFPGRDVGSFLLNTQIAAGWQPRLPGGCFADIGVREEIIRFENDNAQDFETFGAHLGVAKALVDLGDTVFFARYEYQRITDTSWTDESYTVGRIRTGLQKPLFMNARQQLSGSIDAAFDLHTDPRILKRNSYSAELNYSRWLSDRLTGVISWSESLWDFTNDDRQDWNHLVGLGVSYRLTDSATLSGNLFYTNHNADTFGTTNDFESWQTGVNFGCILTF
jgi:hypothetical protein